MALIPTCIFCETGEYFGASKVDSLSFINHGLLVMDCVEGMSHLPYEEACELWQTASTHAVQSVAKLSEITRSLLNIKAGAWAAAVGSVTTLFRQLYEHLHAWRSAETDSERGRMILRCRTLAQLVSDRLSQCDFECHMAASQLACNYHATMLPAFGGDPFAGTYM